MTIGTGADAKVLGPQSVCLMSEAGTQVQIAASEAGAKVMVLTGEPLHEPVAARGPFVMNTQQELGQAVNDFASGRMGK